MRKITKKKKGLFFIKTDCRIYGCICFELEEEEKLVLNILLWTSFIAGLYVESLFDKIIKYVYRREELWSNYFFWMWNWRKWKSFIEFMISVISEKKVQINFLPHHEKKRKSQTILHKNIISIVFSRYVRLSTL